MISGITLSAGHTLDQAGNASAGSKTLLWALPSMVDGLGVATSYNMEVSAGAEATMSVML